MSTAARATGYVQMYVYFVSAGNDAGAMQTTSEHYDQRKAMDHFLGDRLYNREKGTFALTACTDSSRPISLPFRFPRSDLETTSLFLYKDAQSDLSFSILSKPPGLASSCFITPVAYLIVCVSSRAHLTCLELSTQRAAYHSSLCRDPTAARATMVNTCRAESCRC